LLPISQYDTLFNLIGTTYGGDGQQTFSLPNLLGRTPIQQGSNGTTSYVIGQVAGVETGNLEYKAFAMRNEQLLPINQNQALFSLLGTTYGGDGRVNFALPQPRA
jgi:microcystin-dependent protein